jgi:hypothetical protein
MGLDTSQHPTLWRKIPAHVVDEDQAYVLGTRRPRAHFDVGRKTVFGSQGDKTRVQRYASRSAIVWCVRLKCSLIADHKWSMAHAHFLGMGGFTLVDPGKPEGTGTARRKRRPTFPTFPPNQRCPSGTEILTA